jgi:5'-nucleotidase
MDARSSSRRPKLRYKLGTVRLQPERDATYAAISRSIPAIALSASNSAVPYFNVTNATHPAALAAKASYAVVEQFIDATAEGSAVLPLGYGVNVNIPELSDATLPPVVKSRLTGEAETDVAVFDAEAGTFTWGNVRPLAAGVNTCYNGDCSLPGETYVVANGGISVSVFTIDYDAPSIPYTEMVFAKVESLFGGSNGTSGYQTKPAPKKRMMTGRDVYRM